MRIAQAFFSAPAERGTRTRLRQFEHPAQPVQKKEPPRQGEPADAVRAPRSVGAGKRRVQPAIKIFKKICVTLLQNTRK
ncbi:hypothetical protein DW742_14165 [Butyricicoccus sp. AM28-25]|nr:hypothetical protein DW742_14165 [Butyricicoccus sp. AM28-25]